MIDADCLTDVTDRLLLEGQRAAERDDWVGVATAADEALKNDPARAEAMYLVAQALRKMGNDGAALAILTLASKLEPKRAAIWLAMGQCLQERHPAEAYEAGSRAIALAKGGAIEADAMSLLCNLSSQLGKNEEALDWAERFEAKYGVHGEVCHNRSFALFALGRWKEAWREFKPSYGMANRKKRNYHAGKETPRWNPNKHEGATVVIHGEQGIGDEIMYASMIPVAIAAAEAKGSRVIIECYARNRDLFAGSFAVPVYGTVREAYQEWPRDEGVTHRLEMGGLGGFFAEAPFRRDAYILTERARKESYAAWLRVSRREHLRPAVGIAWTGGSWETGRARRSVPFELILQLMRGQDATFVCLEYEDRAKDLEFAPHVLNPHWATRKGADTAELAALVSNLDLVISVQTSVVDLAGALGVPCWALCDANPQWRYTGFFGDDTMGFYESVKVYRQGEPGAWGPVVQRVARDLKAWTEAKAPA